VSLFNRDKFAEERERKKMTHHITMKLHIVEEALDRRGKTKQKEIKLRSAAAHDELVKKKKKVTLTPASSFSFWMIFFIFPTLHQSLNVDKPIQFLNFKTICLCSLSRSIVISSN
jgi:hypothetical protein